MGRVEGKSDSIDKTQRCQTKMFGDSDLYQTISELDITFTHCSPHMSEEPRITVQLLPPLGVKDRMVVINRILKCGTERALRTRHTDTLQEHSKVASRTEGINTYFIGLLKLSIVHSLNFATDISCQDTMVLLGIPQGQTRLCGVRDVQSGPTNEVSQRR